VRTVPPSPTVELVVLDEDATELRRAVAALAPAEHQLVYSGRAAVTLPEADADPFRTPFAVVHEREAIGFGVLDRSPLLLALLPVDPAQTVLLRAFYLDERFQGRGLGRVAIAGVGRLVQDRWADVDHVTLTVNVTNVRAREAYLAAGFRDAGERYAGGSAGPQHVLHLTIRRRPPPTADRPGTDP
jgi:GNAT superfamily N-acetyltransferase